MDEEPAIGDDDVIIPIVAECDDSFLNDTRRMQVSRDDVRDALAAARASAGRRRPPAEGAVGAGTGMSCLGFKGGIGTASRLVPGGGHRRGAHDDQLRRPGPAHRRRRAGRAAAAARPGDAGGRPGPAGSCIVVVLTDGPLDAAACQRLARRAGPGPGPDGQHRAPRQRRDLPGPGHRAARAARRPRRPGPRSPAARWTTTSPRWSRPPRRPCSTACCRPVTVTGRDGHTSYGLPAGRAARAGRAGHPAGQRDGTGCTAARRSGGAAGRRRPAAGAPAAGGGPDADPYAWMRDRDRPQMRDYLAAERAYYDRRPRRCAGCARTCARR